MANTNIIYRTNYFRVTDENAYKKIYNNIYAEDIEDWDSLEQINLIVAIENEFEMMFDMAEIADLAEMVRWAPAA